MIRRARREDVPAILAIYAPYIEHTTVTFEYEVPSLEAFVERYDRIAARYPWIVWEEDGRVLGYAYADEAFTRAAFAWDADLSIYLSEEARGRGIGGCLYGCLEEILKRYGYHNLYGLITGENFASVRFHERRGYEQLGVLKRSGFKHGRWLDVYWYGLRLCPVEAPEGRPGDFACDEADLRAMAEHSEMGRGERICCTAIER